MRIGILGGTFDPIHYGHLVLAEEARATLDLARVLLVPAHESPLKLHEQHSPAEHRWRMVELAIAGNPNLALSDVDLRRPAPSFTVDTLELLRQEHGPDADLYFLMGIDSLAGILSWRSPARILALATLVAAERPGATVDLEALEAALPGLGGRLRLLHIPEIGISSRDLRRRVRAGLPIRYQVPEAVEAYIREQNLYRDPVFHGAGCGGHSA
ncbi:MAG: nicotinate-nucleotide adenylyltransferase [Anaerolineae bacterium]